MATPRLPAFYRLVVHERIDSTNAEAKRLAADGAAGGTLVWAARRFASALVLSMRSWTTSR